MKKIAKSVTHKVEKVGEKAKSKVSSVSSAGKNGSDKGSPEGGTPEKLDNRYTTLQSLTNTKLSSQRFWPCHENGLIKTLQTIPHNLYVSFKSASLYCGLG